MDRRDDGRRSMVWLGHPLYGEVVREVIEPDERTELAAALLERIERDGLRRGTDLVSGALLALESGQWHRTELLSRAADQLVDLDPTLTNRLASAALTQGTDALASAALARRAARAGDLESCEKHARAAMDDPTASPRARARAAEALATALFFIRLDPDAAILVAEKCLAEVGPIYGAELAARLALLYSTTYRNEQVREVTDAGLAAEIPGPARVRLSFARAMTECLSGDTGTAIAIVSDALPLAFQLTPGYTLEAGDLAASATFAFALNGRFDDADDVATQMGAVDEMGTGWELILRGLVSLERGELTRAIEELEEGARIAEEGVVGVRGHFGYSLAAQAHGLLGHADRAAELLSIVIDGFGAQAISAQHMAQAEALVLAAEGRRREGIDSLIRSAETALDHGIHMDALRSLHMALRLGAPWPAISAIERIEVDGTLGPTMIDHAVARRDRDADATMSVATRFEAVGSLLRAGEAYLDAADLFDRHRRSRAATDARVRGGALIDRCGAVGPTARRITGVTPLTAREREIVDMAAAGLTDKQIAAQLVVSVRTVEGHLHRAYVKLGVTTRAELMP